MLKRERGNSPIRYGRRSVVNTSDNTTEIIDYFSECRSKQDVVEALADFASRYFHCVTVYAVRRQVIEKVAAYCDVDGPASAPSGRMRLYQRCIANGRPYCGPIPVMDMSDPTLATLLAILPDRCWVHPMAIGEQVDCLLYAEMPKTDGAQCTERLAFLVQKALLALRRLLISRLLVSSEPAE